MPEPRDKLDTTVNGPEDPHGVFDGDAWQQVDWRTHEERVRRLRRRIFKAVKVLIRLEKHVLREVERILGIADQPEGVVVDTLLPPGDQEVISLHIPPPRFHDQVAIFNFAKDQSVAPLVKTQVAPKKSDI